MCFQRGYSLHTRVKWFSLSSSQVCSALSTQIVPNLVFCLTGWGHAVSFRDMFGPELLYLRFIVFCVVDFKGHFIVPYVKSVLYNYFVSLCVRFSFQCLFVFVCCCFVLVFSKFRYCLFCFGLVLVCLIVLFCLVILFLVDPFCVNKVSM